MQINIFVYIHITKNEKGDAVFLSIVKNKFKAYNLQNCSFFEKIDWIGMTLLENICLLFS